MIANKTSYVFSDFYLSLPLLITEIKNGTISDNFSFRKGVQGQSNN